MNFNFLHCSSLFSAVLLIFSLPPVFAQAVLKEDDSTHQSEAHAKRFLPPFSKNVASDFPGYDVHFYGISLDINPTARTISGFTDIGISLTENRSSINFALISPLVIDSIRAGSHRLMASAPTSTGIRALTFPRSFPVDTSFLFRVYYHGAPDVSYDAIRFGSSGGSPIVWTLSEPYGAMYWFPNRNIPSDKADSVSIRVSVPTPLTVASNGKLISRTSENGKNTFHWKTNYPTANYLVSLAIADYQEFTQYFKWQNDSTPVMNFWYKSSNLETLKSQNLITIQQLDLFSKQFGLYPFFAEKYGHAQFTFSGGMEHQTISSMANLGEGLSAHELMHQWFGDAVTCATWQDIWFNEGFATYGEGLWIEKSRGAEAFRSWRQNQHNSALGTPNGIIYLSQSAVDFSNSAHVNNIFNFRLSYVKSSVAVDMLRYVLGDAEFFRIMTKLVQDTWKHKSITTAEFQTFLETESGKSLDWFFDQWIYKSGFPKYAVTWESTKQTSGDFLVKIRVAQTAESQTVSLFRMPLEFRLSNTARDSVFQMEQTQLDQLFSITLPFEPLKLELDPEVRVLKSSVSVVRNRVDEIPGSLPKETRLLSVYPNPFNPEARVKFELKQAENVMFRFVDVSGRTVMSKSMGRFSAGSYDFALPAGNLPTGVYLLYMEAGSSKSSKKITILK